MRNVEREERDGIVHRRVGEWLEALNHGQGASTLAQGVVTSWRIKMGSEEDPMVLLVVKASDEGGDWIAFIGAPSPCRALLAWRAREASGGMKWRVDKPWEETQGK